MHSGLQAWVSECERLCRPDRVVWCDGSEEEYQKLLASMVDRGQLSQLHSRTYPNCFLHRSHPNDVARVEHCTFICTSKQEDAGPTNNWLSPSEAKAKVRPIFEGCMQGRTMYVVPYLMGPAGSPFSKVGVEI